MELVLAIQDIYIFIHATDIFKPGYYIFDYQNMFKALLPLRIGKQRVREA